MNTIDPMSTPVSVSPAPRRRISFVVSLMIVFLIGIFLGRYVLSANTANFAPLQFVTVEEGERQLIFPTFWEAWDILHSHFIGEIQPEKLYYGAVEGMVRASGDPYTVFADPNTTKRFEESLSGHFSGVGIEIGIQNELVTVISPLRDSPADKAGIQAGDIIVAVDKVPITAEMSLDEIVQKIRGPKGSSVMLTVLHKDAKGTTEINIVRDTIEVESVRVEYKDTIAHITLTNFREDTARQFNTIAQDIVRRKSSGIVLDMRGNPGGFLQAAVEISAQFVPADAVVVSEKGKENKEYKAKGPHVLQHIPVVVLVDGGSASAAEIVAGAVQDQRNAPIIGIKTFGKGSVQEFIKLKDGSSLRVTVAKWYTPKGNSIHEQGITPTIEIKDDRETEQDEQLDRAIEELKQHST